jgi:hypothetical protein
LLPDTATVLLPDTSPPDGTEMPTRRPAVIEEGTPVDVVLRPAKDDVVIDSVVSMSVVRLEGVDGPVAQVDMRNVTFPDGAKLLVVMSGERPVFKASVGGLAQFRILGDTSSGNAVRLLTTSFDESVIFQSSDPVGTAS